MIILPLQALKGQLSILNCVSRLGKGVFLMKKGFTLIELLIVIAIIAILAAIAVPNFLEAQVRAKVSRVKADQRSLATGLEAYCVDNNSYPAWVCQQNNGMPCGQIWNVGALGSANGFSGTGTGASKIHTFRTRYTNPPAADDLMFMLTTPISYVTSFFSDPFAATRGACYGYYAQKMGWIVISFGPDMDESGQAAGDLDPYLEVALTGGYKGRFGDSVYDYRIAQPTLMLTTLDGKIVTGNSAAGGDANAFTYDPTNGTGSEGDVWRTKQ